MKPSLKLIHGDGPVEALIELSEGASVTFFALEQSCQELVKDGLIRAYSKSLRRLAEMSLNPYSISCITRCDPMDVFNNRVIAIHI